MRFVFDPEKDAANVKKHGLCLSRASELDPVVYSADRRRDYGEMRIRVFGLLDGRMACLVYAVRGDDARVISLRQAHFKEYRKYVPRP